MNRKNDHNAFIWMARDHRVRDFMRLAKTTEYTFMALDDSDAGADTVLIYSSNNPKDDACLCVNVAACHVYFLPPSETEEHSALIQRLFAVLYKLDPLDMTPMALTVVINNQTSFLFTLQSELRAMREELNKTQDALTESKKQVLELRDELSVWIMRQRIEDGLEEGIEAKNSETYIHDKDGKLALALAFHEGDEEDEKAEKDVFIMADSDDDDEKARGTKRQRF